MWLRSSGLPPLYRRLNGTALRALQQARLPNEPDEVGWLMGHADLLAERLTKAGKISAGTATTYASRLRNVAREFLSASQTTDRSRQQPARSRLAQALTRVPAPTTPAEEVAEATAVVGRWPSLVHDLLPALVRAMDRLGLSETPPPR
jgi:hypothetical protein